MPLPDGLVEAPPGPVLAPLLDDVAFALISGRDTVEAMAVAHRQACHYRAVFLLALLETGLRQPGSGDVVRRVAHPGEFAGEEARAALVWSRRRADTAFNLAYGVFCRLPMIGEAMLAGDLDEPRAAAMVTWTAELADEHATRVCADVLPAAAQMTVGAVIDEVKRLAVAIDPDWAERTYRAAVKRRDVIGVRNPAGTVDVTGRDLPVDRAAAGCDRVATLARQCKRAGDRRPIGQIRADLFLGMLDGTFTELNDQQIVDHVRAHNTGNQPGSDEPGETGSSGDNPDDGDDPGGGPSSGPSGDPGDVPNGGNPYRTGSGDGSSGARSSEDDDPYAEGVPADAVSGDDAIDDGGPAGSRPADASGSRGGPGRWSVRELRVQLATLVEVDEQPTELPGWGYVSPGMAREIVAGMAAAQWRYVVCDTDGYPIDVGLVRRRPTLDPGHDATRHDPTRHGDAGRGDTGRGGRAGVVEIAATARVLDRLAAEVAAGSHQAWAAVITEISHAYNGPDTAPNPGNADAGVDSGPRVGLSSESRFARGRLRRWILTRDRACTHPSCRAPASGVDVDHSVDHAHGGRTDEVNLGGRCRHDHSIKHKGGWQIIQVSPLVTVWISPLGHRYENRPPPVIPPPVPTRLRVMHLPAAVTPARAGRAPCDGDCDRDRPCADCRPVLPPPRHVRDNNSNRDGEVNSAADGGGEDLEWLPEMPRQPTSPWATRYRQAADTYYQRRLARRFAPHWAAAFRSRLHNPTRLEFNLEAHLQTTPRRTDDRRGDEWRGDDFFPAESSPRQNHGVSGTPSVTPASQAG